MKIKMIIYSIIEYQQMDVWHKKVGQIFYIRIEMITRGHLHFDALFFIEQ